MGNLRIILANEPRSYREAMARAIAHIRPEADVRYVDPAGLDGELAGCEEPCLVVCSHASRAVERKALSWIELYPGGEPLARVNISGARFEKDDMSLEDLLSAVDHTLFTLGGCEGSGTEKSLI